MSAALHIVVGELAGQMNLFAQPSIIMIAVKTRDINVHAIE